MTCHEAQFQFVLFEFLHFQTWANNGLEYIVQMLDWVSQSTCIRSTYDLCI